MKIVSDKPLRIATTHGAVIMLEPGVPREMSLEIAVLALQEGAKEVKKDTVKKDTVKKDPFSDTTTMSETVDIVLEPKVEEGDRFKKLVSVLLTIIEEGNPDSFKTDGTPKATVVNKAFGSAVLTDEREAAWQEALNSR